MDVDNNGWTNAGIIQNGLLKPLETERCTLNSAHLIGIAEKYRQNYDCPSRNDQEAITLYPDAGSKYAKPTHTPDGLIGRLRNGPKHSTNIPIQRNYPQFMSTGVIRTGKKQATPSLSTFGTKLTFYPREGRHKFFLYNNTPSSIEYAINGTEKGMDGLYTDPTGTAVGFALSTRRTCTWVFSCVC
ncbi:hypothetical protein BEWA_028560 [Theileria equi strain WA]|uniref:Uncharacterized protein n=1 Tax=Theileria equi strain WA TaxID=1537102 RepID=L0AYC0_THEEQ|nr:hypothetical protein BEWA_028560 [Theileria equi strain WA]AFZ80006.1 hypothetical protein BEWA_028560 [Theileria equi strain WA]|eukprot:XP_004829672.1 hypothetical protein BEWA_028560 [Theileria equi strain WA]